MKARKIFLVLLTLIGILLLLNGCGSSSDCDCPDELKDSETGVAFDGQSYLVRYHTLKNDGTPDYVDANGNKKYDVGETFGRYFCPKSCAVWVRDGAINTHNLLTNSTYGFKAPNFSDKPNRLCINEVNARGMACGDQISIHDHNCRESGENFIRQVVAHEMFHQTQYAYIDKDEWQAWGQWLVEGSATYITDKLYWDIDSEPGATKAFDYLDRVRTYIQKTNESLLEDHSYGGALFWTYITEQLGKTLSEPARGVDFLQGLATRADGQSPATIRYLEETIDDFSNGTTSFVEIFLDFSITNYTHNLTLSSLANKYPDYDQPKRDYTQRYSYYDETAAGGNSNYGDVVKKTVPGWNQEVSGSIKRWASQYYEIDVTKLDLKGCDTLAVRGQADSGKELGWALVGVKSGGVVEIYRYVGNTLYTAFLSDQAKTYDQLALVVVGLNAGSGFKFTFSSGKLTPEIMLPTASRVARVGEKNNPQRFQVRLHLDGPSVLTPSGGSSPSVRGIDVTKLNVYLIGKKAYTAKIINSSYVDGEYWLVIQAPKMDATEGDLFDLQVCVCRDSAGTCQYAASSSKSVVYGKFVRNQVIVLDRSGSMGWYGGIKFDAAQNAARLAVDAGSDSDRMGVVTFWGWSDNDRECEEEATLVSDLLALKSNRSTLINAIEVITIGGSDDGWTALGDGLILAAQKLLANQQLHKYDEDAILLLSDGLPNRRLYWETDNSSCSNASKVSDEFASTGKYAGFKIYTEGFGPDADMGLLTRIAKATGGQANAVRTEARHCPLSDPLCMEVSNRLAESFRRVQEEFLGLDRLFYDVSDLVPSSAVLEIPISVNEKSGGGVQNAAFAFNWNDASAGVTVELWDPQGNKISTATTNWVIATPASQSSQTNIVYHYHGVLPTGTWTAKAWAANGKAQLLSMLSGKILHGVDVSLDFSQINDHGSQTEYSACPPAEGEPPYLRGLPVTILVKLNDSQGGIAGLKDVTAVINNYEAASNQISLYDDGNHEDGLADDGIYGNSFTRTPFYATDQAEQDETGAEPSPPNNQTGVYSVYVHISGKNNAGEDFERFISRDFHILEYSAIPPCEEPDLDRDGLPDRWEELVGLDTSAPGHAQDDPDNDGLDNTREFYLGTHPYDADTDGGGQADGSETTTGQDPLYDQDDKIPLVIDYGVVKEGTDIPFNWPQPKTIILHFSADPAHTRMQIWRSDKPNPIWSDFVKIATVDLTQKPRGIYYDQGLTSGAVYYYYLVAEGVTSDVLSPPTGYFIGTPP